MSAEVHGSNPRNIQLVGEVAQAAASILVATGTSAETAYTVGERAAAYAADILLSALEMTGEISAGKVSDEHFIGVVRQIGQATVDPEILPTLQIGSDD